MNLSKLASNWIKEIECALIGYLCRNCVVPYRDAIDEHLLFSVCLSKCININKHFSLLRI